MEKDISKQSRITLGPKLDVEQMMLKASERWAKLSTEEQQDLDRRFVEAFPGGFSARDEANALVAMAVRNGPIENLHAGKYSPLLEDAALSRITDEEMKVLMIAATRVLAGLLEMREKNPELYRRSMQTYGMMYCAHWER